MLFGAGHRHVTAESLHAEVKATRIPVALATVYNALNQFRDAGLLHEVVVAPGRSYFDTNTGHHHHFFVENDGELHDFPADEMRSWVEPMIDAVSETLPVLFGGAPDAHWNFNSCESGMKSTS